MKELRRKIVGILFDATYEQSGSLLIKQLDAIVGSEIMPLIRAELKSVVEGLHTPYPLRAAHDKQYEKGLVDAYNWWNERIDEKLKEWRCE